MADPRTTIMLTELMFEEFLRVRDSYIGLRRREEQVSKALEATALELQRLSRMLTTIARRREGYLNG